MIDAICRSDSRMSERTRPSDSRTVDCTLRARLLWNDANLLATESSAISAPRSKDDTLQSIRPYGTGPLAVRQVCPAYETEPRNPHAERGALRQEGPITSSLNVKSGEAAQTAAV